MSNATKNSVPGESQNGTANGEYRHDSKDPSPNDSLSDKVKSLADYVDRSRKPLVNGTSIEIDEELIAQAEVALQIELPLCPVSGEVLEPIGHWNNEKIAKHVSDTLLATPIIASILFISKTLRGDSEIRDTELSRIEQRQLNRQAMMPLKIPASKVLSEVTTDANGKRRGGKPLRSWFVELFTFWRNWSGVGAAALAIALLMTLGLEIFSQVNGLKRGSWELVQTYSGAFGFTWGFTVAVVAFTRWREQIWEAANATHLEKVMSRRFIYISWIGLTNMGLHLGLMHSFGTDEPWLFGVHRCLLTTFSVVSLGGVGVVIEKWAIKAVNKAYAWTLIHNLEVDEMEKQIHPITTKRTLTRKLMHLSDAIVNRVEQHIKSQTVAWCSHIEACREKSKKADERAIAVEKLNAAQHYLKSLG